MTVPDRLERRIEVAVPRDRVWAAFTIPSELTRWFPTHAADVDLRVGGAMRFAWEDTADEAVVEVLEPPERLVFRWRPEGTDRPCTTVTVELRETAAGGTEVVLSKQGFANLPGQIHEQPYEGNAAGWAEELAELEAFLAREAA